MFKKLIITSLAVAAGVCLATGQANAAFIQNQFFLNELQQLSDNSAESQNVDLNDNGLLDVGDTLRGIFYIETIEDLSGGGGTNNLTANGVELAAVFEIQVATKNPASTGQAGRFDYTFEPYAPFEATYGDNAMIALFEDTDLEYTRLGGTIASLIANVTNGDLVMTWGIPDLGEDGYDADNYWAAFNAPDDTSLATVTSPATGIGQFNLGLSILLNELFAGVIQVGAGCPALPTALPAGQGCEGDNLVDINGSGGILGTQGVNTPFDVFNNVDFVLRPVPEPGTLGMLGLGLAGLGFFALRRRGTVA